MYADEMLIDEITDMEMPFNENEELALAHEFLSVSNEQELDYFLGNLLRRAWGGIKRFAASPQGQKIGSLVKSNLKSTARNLIPQVGAQVGNYIGGNQGGAMGQSLGNWVNNRFLKETDFEDYEDNESCSCKKPALKTARKFVRYAGHVAKKASTAPKNVSPVKVVKVAVKTANRKIAAVRPVKKVHGSQQRGSWVKRGNRIVLLGA